MEGVHAYEESQKEHHTKADHDQDLHGEVVPQVEGNGGDHQVHEEDP